MKISYAITVCNEVKEIKKLISILLESKREDDVLLLREKYPDIWGKRGKAMVVADKENLNIRTIQKYFKDFPI